MKKISHIIWTFSLSLWIFKYLVHLNFIEIIIFSSISSFFSSLPDIDLKIVIFFKKLNYRYFFILTPIYYLIKLIFKHRGLTHSFIFSSIFYLLFILFSFNKFISLFFLSIFIAVILHIFEDSLTILGVKPFYPLNFKIRFANFSTNSILSEIILNFIGFLIGIFFLFSI